MSNDFLPDAPNSPPSADNEPTLGMSAIYKLFEAFVGLREKNAREHKLFESSLNKTRDVIQTSFNSFAADTQRAYQSLRQEIHGEKRMSLQLLNQLLEVGMDLQHMAATRPKIVGDSLEIETMNRWADAIEIESRKVLAALERLGIHAYDAVIASPYNPALHERVGSVRMEGMSPLLIAEQRERGYASQQPEFVLRRPKVIVSD